MSHRLLWGPAVDQALADEVGGGGEVYWYFTDHLGSVRDVATYNTTTNVTTIANHIAFDSFGRRVSETSSSLGDFDLGFTGKWFDRATGLQWNLNRWYNSAIQRWMSEDFIWDGANKYAYVGNSSTVYIDPDGLEAQPSESGGIGSSGWNPWNWPVIYHIAVWPWTIGIKQRSAEIEDNIRRQLQERALANPECADPEALRPYASNAEIGLMKEYAEAGVQYNAMVLGGGALRPGSGAGGFADDAATGAVRNISRVWPKHHPFPKYLGGAPGQTLRKIPRSVHLKFHSALDCWKDGKYARSLGAEHFKNITKEEVIGDLVEFYQSAEGGIFKKYLPDFLNAVEESGYPLPKDL